MTTSTLPRGNLPAELTTFIGRRSELAQARKQLAESRLLTLTGVGGVGKSRLALRLAREVSRAFPDGVWLVELATLGDPSLVASRVAVTLGLRENSVRLSLAVLTEYVADRQLLVVLDNCEHLLDACSIVVDSLLRRAPKLHILTTSRQPLGVAGEQVLSVPSLSMPQRDSASHSPQELGKYDAVALFVERARASDPLFVVAAGNMDAVSQLVQRLDGIPLALELAAARIRMLSPQQIVSRLGESFRLLTSSATTAPHHQRSLQALIDWSFNLCTDAERALWARLSVFPRDFDLDAVEHVCSGNGLMQEEVFSGIAGLVDKSVLVAVRVEGQVRYRLPEALREYGKNLLAEWGEQAPYRCRHSDYYATLSKQAWREWFGPSQVDWTSWIQVEQVNLRVALQSDGLEPGAESRGYEVVPALSIHWSVSGAFEEGRRLIDRALAVRSEPSTGRATLLWAAAWLAVNQGDIAAAAAAASESRHLATRFGDADVFAAASLSLAAARLSEGDPEGAERFFREAIERGGRRSRAAVLARRGLARIATGRGDFELAASCLEESVSICQEHGESWEQGGALWSESLMRWEQGDAAAASKRASESLRLRALFPDHAGIAQCLEMLAWTAGAQGAYERAATLLGAAAATWTSIGASLFPHLADAHADCEAIVRDALGDRAFAGKVANGTNLALADRVAYALAERRPVTTNVADDGPLTRREIEIAQLIADGMSNREIAAKLVISQRTAEGHVEHILAKLGFSSRVQIAAWVVERRSASPPG
jgi:predicted ATPase/DNA-binding NarL/FixJ family response regulator